MPDSISTASRERAALGNIIELPPPVTSPANTDHGRMKTFSVLATIMPNKGSPCKNYWGLDDLSPGEHDDLSREYHLQGDVGAADR